MFFGQVASGLVEGVQVVSVTQRYSLYPEVVPVGAFQVRVVVVLEVFTVEMAGGADMVEMVTGVEVADSSTALVVVWAVTLYVYSVASDSPVSLHRGAPTVEMVAVVHMGVGDPAPVPLLFPVPNPKP